MMTVEDLLAELSEFPKHLKVRMQVETVDTRPGGKGVYYQILDIEKVKLEDDEVYLEHE